MATEINSHIKDQLISGVNQQLMRYELLKASTKTLDELVELAKTVEMADTYVYLTGYPRAHDLFKE